ncbi:MAG: hypothetical protein JWO90_1415 [Solirubrobacterales bacterium]|nr:hypothetical protein [Solirubrobacterales bacterium]MCW3011011.1 hypothetical protein [Solirubrobacterales bacterium]
MLGVYSNGYGGLLGVQLILSRGKASNIPGAVQFSDQNETVTRTRVSSR